MNNMISVVIPTMWKHAPFCDFLNRVCAHEHVSDVIIVDNNRANRPQHQALHHKKITLLDFGQNIFVNPSWNVGVYHAASDHICLQNDDIKFDCAVYEKVDHFLLPHMGLISLSGDAPQSEQIEIELWQGGSMFGCGQLMFFHRSQFSHIHSELLVYCGDNWLFDHMWHVTQQNYMIKNLQHHTPYAQTSQHFRHMLSHEQQIYEHMCEKLGMQRLHV